MFALLAPNDKVSGKAVSMLLALVVVNKDHSYLRLLTCRAQQQVVSHARADIRALSLGMVARCQLASCHPRSYDKTLPDPQACCNTLRCKPGRSRSALIAEFTCYFAGILPPAFLAFGALLAIAPNTSELANVVDGSPIQMQEAASVLISIFVILLFVLLLLAPLLLHHTNEHRYVD